ncbi:YciI family protein [Streptosporangium sp. NPDC051023]|uniref:YciI family protein n=1 Tax=Streptosporangium sp. NPDC051023 TaxID=3155410 RepID=UPI00344F3D63
MKYLLSIYTNPKVWNALPERVRDDVWSGRGRFVETIKRTGEFLGANALEDLSHSAVIKVRDGLAWVTGGPFVEGGECLTGYYVVECESTERAHAIAAMIPDTRIEGSGIEVRPIVFSAGAGA